MASVAGALIGAELRRPRAWLIGSCFLILPAITTFLSPFPDRPRDELAAHAAREWAWIAGLVGAAVGMAGLTARESFLDLLPPGARFRSQVLLMLGLSLTLQGVLLLGVLTVPSGFRTAEALAWAPGALLTDLHLAGLAVLSLRGARAVVSRLFFFSSAAWILPTVAVDEREWAQAIRAVFDSQAHMRLPVVLKNDPGAALASLLPVAGLLLLGWTLTSDRLRSSP